ncbi:hypothetical protein LXT21_03985 [Myxococcus sp. K38C18041901]|uniref:hypothetical protein n=1 Tax=Myxococcus guangdongensis TaxID=2906760 RepID=UPI0020A77173|nr:hypothetical protein [Myxococcus guangdongensis]MCP3057932.1 hypothetical protein [Myxococcus guangdongensis]
MEPEAKLEQETASGAPMRVWTQLAPGVWERPNAHGGYERSAWGVEGFEFMLQTVRMERVFLKLQRTEKSDPVVFEKRLAANEKLLRTMEEAVLESREAQSTEPPSASPYPPNTYNGWGKRSGMLCGGYFYLDIQFSYAWGADKVRTIAETGGTNASTYTRKLHTFAEAWTDALSDFQSDWDTSPPIGTPTYHFQTSEVVIAGTLDPTYMWGRAVVTGGDGCPDSMAFFEALNHGADFSGAGLTAAPPFESPR